MSAPNPLMVELTAARHAAGISVSAIARRTGYAESTIRSWERGDSVPDLDTATDYGHVVGLALTLSPIEGAAREP